MRHSRFYLRMRRYFATGLFSLLPSVIVGWVIYFLVGRLKQATEWVLALVSIQERYWWGELLFPTIFLILAVTLTILVGVVSTTLVGRGTARIWGRVITRIPILSKIYTSIQQVLTTLAQRRTQAFKSVVLMSYPYPHPGMYRLGFVTTDGIDNMIKDEELVAVFVPSSPNPFSGFLFIVNKDHVVPLDIQVEDGIKMIVSGGFVTPNLVRPDIPPPNSGNWANAAPIPDSVTDDGQRTA
ncbi:MAG: DUF502 domain-containing protein [Candidatus Poribacteria bacterium]|nr:DUF502 domain-containing protein [Candidatus Poribacteria bacterium]